VILGRAVQLDRHVDQAEGDRALPDGPHAPSIPRLIRERVALTSRLGGECGSGG
jgi:hypothetical protein